LKGWVGFMLKIRPETVQDYAAISAVHVQAFDERPGEAVTVALHRQRPAFDSELSLVAEEDGRVVGHVLFSPHRVHLFGQEVLAVNLAPIGVAPAYQDRGIGASLLEVGHRIVRTKGYAFSFLLGHPSYYPRFGYLTHAYGSSTFSVPASAISPLAPEEKLLAHPLKLADIPALYTLWQRAEGSVDFALDPGMSLLDWVSPNPAIKTTVFTEESGKVMGYTRLHSAQPAAPRVFLARNNRIAWHMLAHLATAVDAATVFELPLHPFSSAAPGLGEANYKTWEAAMVYPLFPGLFDEYYAQVSAGERPPGRPIWPTLFDLD
jgi:putative acetyltransferase